MFLRFFLKIFLKNYARFDNFRPAGVSCRGNIKKTMSSDQRTLQDAAGEDLFEGIPLTSVFSSPATAGARTALTGLLRGALVKYPAPPADIPTDFCGEEFYLLMPTEAAFECELGLCRALMQSGDPKFELILDMSFRDYLDTHLFVYIPGKREIKRGDPANWYQGTLLRLTTAPREAVVCNPVQLWLFHLLNPLVKGTYCFL